MKKSDPGQPPRNWYKLKEMLAKFAALLWVLFGDVCPLYNKIYKLWRGVETPLYQRIEFKIYKN